MAIDPLSESVDRAQRLRLRRMVWGFAGQACALTVVVVAYFLDLVPGAPVLVWIGAMLVIDLAMVTMILTGLNLRFADPSLTTLHIVGPLLPSVFLMYFVTDAQARMAFLLLAAAALMFGVLALDRRQMILVGWLAVTAYLILLSALAVFAPARIDLQVEFVIVIAYASVLMTVAILGSYIAGMRLKLKEQNARLEELATRDPLTHLPNRRSVMDQLAREKSRADRRTPGQTELCVAMLDIDRFKQVNDNWGHEVGDAVLMHTAAILTATLRNGDFVGRFGGEEFVVILPETTKPGSMIAAERLRKAVANATFPELPDGKRITVSIGVAVHAKDETLAQTLKRADDALFTAKREGRDRAVHADA